MKDVDKGKGTGYIECEPIKRNGKEYKQYWYHYEEWQSGDRITKKSKYIPQSKRSQLYETNVDKSTHRRDPKGSKEEIMLEQ